MKRTLLFFISLTTLSLFAQEKGATPLSTQNSSFKTQNSTTYAVVVGISDYQDEGIPDLRFADKDAEAFAAFLRSPAGGNVPADHLIVLQNEKATNARIADALIWMLETCQPGDQAIIYFSGHGDVETITRFNRGYLLTYDSPPKIYMAGAFNIRDLQDIISTMSDNDVQVIMISDACRAGKLAGTEVGGTQATAQNLSQQFANEIKILSCQPNEFSLEGEQWGGGRGAFSYHLLDGLQGLADKNSDGSVNLFEIGRYLEDWVPEETAPHQQMPFTVGDRNAMLAAVDAPTLTLLKERKASEQPQLAQIETKGMEELLLAKVDSGIQEMYADFVAALENKQLLDPKGSSAYDLYQKLSQEKSISDLHNIMRRNLSVALQEDAQQAVNAYLAANPTELQRRFESETDYDLYPRYLEKACELLGPTHFYYKNLSAKLYYFEGLGLRLDADNNVENASYQKAIEKQLKALEFQENAPFVLNELGILHTRLKLDEKAFTYYDQAISLAPQWGLPYVNYSVGKYYTGEIESAIEYGEKALSLMPDYSQVYNFLAWIHANDWSWENKSNWSRKGTELGSDFYFGYDDYSSASQRNNRYEKSIGLLNKGIEIDSLNPSLLFNLGFILLQKNRGRLIESEVERGILLLQKASLYDSLNARIYSTIGAGCQYIKKYEEGEKAHLKAIVLAKESLSIRHQAAYHLILGNLYSSWGKEELALEYYRRASEIDLTYPYGYNNTVNINLRRNEFQEAEWNGLQAIERSSEPLFNRGLGRVYSRLWRYEDAEWFLLKAIEQNPNFKYAKTTLVTLYTSLSHFEKALEWQQNLLEQAPDDISVLINAGRLTYQVKQFEQAETYFQKAVELSTDNGRYFNQIGYFYRLHSEDERAENYFNKAVDLNNTQHWGLAWVLFSTNRKEAAQELLNKGIQNANTPDSKATLLYLKGLFEYYSGHINKSLLHFKEAADINDKYQPLVRAVEKVLEDDLLSASDYFESAIQKNPGADNIKYIYCQLKIQQGDFERALDLLEAALKIGGRTFNFMANDKMLDPIRELHRFKELMRKYFPEKFDDLDTFQFSKKEVLYYPENCVLLARYYNGEGERERADFLYEKAIELKPDSLSDQFALAMAEAYMKLDRMEEARSICPESVESEQKAELLEAGRLFYLLGKKEKAIACFEKAISVSKSASTQNSVAYFYKNHGEHDLAASIFQQAIKTSPDLIYTRRNLSRLYYFHGEKELAFGLLEEAIRLQPNDLATHGVYCLLSYYDQPEKSKALFEKSGFLSIWECLELMRENKFVEADEAWQELQNTNDAWWLELVKYKYLHMKIRQGETDRAFQLFDELLTTGIFVNYQLFKMDNALDPLRDTASFKALMRRYFPEKGPH